MKKIFAWLTIFSFVITIFPASNVSAQPPQNPEKKIFLAVLNLDNKGGVTNEECSLLSESLRENFLKTGRYRIVDRKNMDNILKEQSFQLSDCTSESCIVQVGKLLGVEKMAFGSIGKLGDQYLISIQTINVETGEIDKMASRRSLGSVAELENLLGEIAFEIAGVHYTPIPKLKSRSKEESSWYKKPWVWVLILGVVGGGAYATYALTKQEKKNEGTVSFGW
jgi:TolB-like protein